MVNSITDALKVLLWMAVMFSITAAIVVTSVANGWVPGREDSRIFKYTEGGYECIVYRDSRNSATCKEKE